MTVGPFMKVPEVAEQLGVTVAKVRWYLREGRLRGIRLGRDWLIPKDALARVLEAQSKTHRMRNGSVK
jgi:excisionase family DNA binding protein